jgi:hypothetical protein
MSADAPRLLVLRLPPSLTDAQLASLLRAEWMDLRHGEGPYDGERTLEVTAVDVQRHNPFDDLAAQPDIHRRDNGEDGFLVVARRGPRASWCGIVVQQAEHAWKAAVRNWTPAPGELDHVALPGVSLTKRAAARKVMAVFAGLYPEVAGVLE